MRTVESTSSGSARWPTSLRHGLSAPRADDRLGAAAGAAALAGLLATGIGVAAGAAAGTPFLSSVRGAVPKWLSGPLAEVAPALSPTSLALLLGAMCLCYLGALAAARAMSARLGLGAVVALHAVYAVSPPIITPDVFSYLAYARLDVLHGLNPYTSIPADVPGDAVTPFVVFDDLQSPYGPLFTLASRPLALVGVPVAVWTSKGVAAVASLGCVALVWSTARRLGRAPLVPALIVGLNPLLLVNGVGGAHNDFLMMLLVLGGVRLAAGGREGTAAAAVAAGVAVKATAGLVLPFLVLGARRRTRALLLAMASVAVVLVGWIALFGLEGLAGFLRALRMQNAMVSEVSVPWVLGALGGQGGAGPGVRLAAGVVFLGALALLFVRAWRGAEWMTGAAWAIVALLLTTTWLMPYYVAWLLPMAALGSRRVRVTGVALSMAMAAGRIALLLV